MNPGKILDREGMAEVWAADRRSPEMGDRMVICSTIARGTCPYCHAGHFAQCDNANLNGVSIGTRFFDRPVEMVRTGMIDPVVAAPSGPTSISTGARLTGSRPI